MRAGDRALYRRQYREDGPTRYKDRVEIFICTVLQVSKDGRFATVALDPSTAQPGAKLIRRVLVSALEPAPAD